ncbi:M1 family metallopeptidase [uncultured Croceitalea sp.]|uniref:M1 family metallopeptidase n=1 Tax=uncultured Croceitalea sp. TaxID=1798908 RepID=UPI00330570B0
MLPVEEIDKFRITILALFFFTCTIYGQKIKSNSKKLETLDWKIMYCGRAEIGKKDPCSLYVKNETAYVIQGYRLDYYNQLVKIKSGKIGPYETSKLKTKTNEYWVFGDSLNNALGIFKTTSGTNNITIDDSNFKESVKLPKSIRDRSTIGTPSGGKILIEQQSYDVLHYDLKLEIFTERQYIKGNNTITAKVLKDLEDFVFDLDSLLTIENVYLKQNNRKIKLPVKTINGKHWCKLPTVSKKDRLIIIDIEYSGNPRIATHAPYKGGFSWNKTLDCQPWIATSCQIDGADVWLPCKDYQWDEADSVNLSFTVPKGLKAVSNGILTNKIENNNETTTYDWKVETPINNYNITLNIAPYAFIPDTYVGVTKDSLDLGYWVLPENLDKATEFYAHSKKYLKFLELHLGPYPFRKEKLGVVEVPFVAMEHQTIIAFGPNYSTKYPEYNSTLFHEISHEWFGNMVTALDWKDFWIQESLTGYMEALYEESLRGEQGYKEKVASFKRRLLNKNPLAPATMVNSRQIYSGDSYNKGAYLLHTLRYLMGKDNLLEVLRLMSYPDKNLELINDGGQCRFTSTDEFFSIVNRVSGQDFSWFKNVYFKNATLPKLSITENKEGVMLKWFTKSNMDFSMPLEIKTEEGVLKIHFIDGLAQLNFGMEEIVEIDPNKWILFEKIE